MKALQVSLLAAAPCLTSGIAHAQTIMAVRQFPPQESPQTTDQLLSEQLADQGFGRVKVLRGEGVISASGSENFERVTLTYNAASGKLVGVKGMPDWQFLNDN
ncbi:hypothetical protein [Paracoccus aestuariivivens]|uniref:PepSY domain-containing protein n=1 Tax=Paracoccus aestuariivivens TaxID=1820333 RepID=A0A6L6JF57_9RHOB|nr:hypothetical protein [Paracoccus aestuariivivens]MTH78774.1 hypothetical protein [Paracoccus aestuariivivens]